MKTILAIMLLTAAALSGAAESNLPGSPGKSPEPKPLEQITGVEYVPYHSVANAKRISGKATGFFHLERHDDGRWWLIEPDGGGFVHIGIDHCNYRGHFAWKLGYYLYRKNNDAKYKSQEEWAEETASRLRRWGFNALGSTSDTQLLLKRGFATNHLLRMTESFAKKGEAYFIAPHLKKTSTVFPNVFHPEFEKYCDDFAMQYCLPNRDNPWYIGYYIDNELAWWGRSERHRPVGIFDLVMKKGSTHTAKIALRDFLKSQFGGSVEKFNLLFKTEIKDFDDILKLNSLPDATKEQVAVKERFLGLVAETYFRISTSAVRKADPNHLVLGARFANIRGAVSPLVWKAAGKYCDIVTFNCYPYVNLDENQIYDNPDFSGETIEKQFDALYAIVKRPFLITEWSFPALDAGLPCTRGAGQRFKNQTGRTRASELFARTALSRKYIIGYDYFMWCDEPAGGITEAFPENCNYGLVNANGVPHREITDMFAKLHADVEKLRFDSLPPSRESKPPVLLSAAEAAKGLNAKGRSEFKLENGRYSLANSKIMLAGGIGSPAVFDRIATAGESGSRGTFYTMVGAADDTGRQFWWRGRKVSSVTGKNNPDGSAEMTVLVQGWRWQSKLKVVLPAGADCFLTEPLTLRNIFTQNLTFNGLYYCLACGDDYGPSAPVVPFVWQAIPLGYWIDGGGNYIGSIGPLGSNYRIKFFRNPKSGTLHSDAKFDLSGFAVRLAPKKSWKAPGNIGAMLHLIGGGGEAAFLKSAESYESKLRAEP